MVCSIMQEPFCSIPLIWIVEEDILARRFAKYVEMGWEHLILEWRNALSRADVVVFPDYSLPVMPFSLFVFTVREFCFSLQLN